MFQKSSCSLVKPVLPLAAGGGEMRAGIVCVVAFVMAGRQVDSDIEEDDDGETGLDGEDK